MIEMKNICLTINNDSVIDRLDLTVDTNEKLLITGKSGSGKTTLFKAMMGFLPIDSGTISINGQMVDRRTVRQIRRQVFYLSQDVDLRNEPAGALVRAVLDANDRLDQPDDRNNAIKQFSAILHLAPRIFEKSTADLSGGERQRLGLLIGFLLDRPVWLLDEPTAALDDTMKTIIAGQITRLEKTVVIVSHDPVWQNSPVIRTYRWGC